MRMIGHLESETRARAFGDYLLAQDIENTVEEEAARWAVWVHAEDQLERAGQLLEEFLAAPDERKYLKASRVAREKREQKQADDEAARKRYYDRTNLFSMGGIRLGRVTLGLLGMSLLVTLVTGFGGNPLFSWFAITPIHLDGPFPMARTDPGALLTWQIWRWFTPMFIHMNFLHLLFNLWWLKDLGGALEKHLGGWSFLGLALLISGPANIAQFLAAGPMFGGMSGVVYGLLGYIWIRGRLDPFCGLFLHPSTVSLMAIWFFLCLFGVIPNVANVVHGVGLGMGLLAGLTASRQS